MDNDLEKKVKECFNCQSTRHRPPPAPLHPWEWPERPWSRLHADYAGPFLGKMFLIVVDAYSKWLEVIPVSIGVGKGGAGGAEAPPPTSNQGG